MNKLLMIFVFCTLSMGVSSSCAMDTLSVHSVAAQSSRQAVNFDEIHPSTENLINRNNAVKNEQTFSKLRSATRSVFSCAWRSILLGGACLFLTRFAMDALTIAKVGTIFFKLNSASCPCTTKP